MATTMVLHRIKMRIRVARPIRRTVPIKRQQALYRAIIARAMQMFSLIAISPPAMAAFKQMQSIPISNSSKRPAVRKMRQAAAVQQYKTFRSAAVATKIAPGKALNILLLAFLLRSIQKLLWLRFIYLTRISL